MKENVRTLSQKPDQLHKLASARSVSRLPRPQTNKIHPLDEFESIMPETSNWVSCSTIPHQRNHGFYGINKELEEITKSFEGQSSSKIRTVALWGTGGIGKSQVALEYAYERREGGTTVILWIASDTDAEVARSFREAAQNLRVEGYSITNTLDENRHYVLQWLETTGKKSLLLDPIVATSSDRARYPLVDSIR